MAVAAQQAVAVVQADGSVVTNYTAFTNLETRAAYLTNTVWQVAPGVSETIATANAVSPLIPQPFGSAVTFGSGVLAVVLGAIAKRKNDQNASLVGQLEAVVRGVETASAALPEGNKIKQVIADVAGKLAVSDDLRKTVKSLT